MRALLFSTAQSVRMGGVRGGALAMCFTRARIKGGLVFAERALVVRARDDRAVIVPRKKRLLFF